MRYSAFFYGTLGAVLLFTSGLAATGGGTATAAPDVAIEAQSEEIVSLARSGKNLEAIAMFEALPADADLSMVMMRAVAGCYWRERQFDKSRELYQRILDRRPTLRQLSSSGEAPKPLLAKDEEEDAEMAAVETAPPKASESVDVAKMSAELDALREANRELGGEREAELAKLREANARLAEEREALRKKTAERIATLAKTAEMSSADIDALRSELAEERKRREAAEVVAKQIQGSLGDQEQALLGKIASLEGTLASTRVELEKTLETSRSELDALAKEREKREASENMAKAIQQSLEERETELSDELAALDTELRSARAALEQSELDASERVQATEVRAAALTERVELLESQANAARANMVELGHALEAARLRNAEMAAAQSAVADRTASTLEAAENVAFAKALEEIDALEQEYAVLDASARKRQKALLERIDALEQASVTSEVDLAEARRQLELERSLRKALQAQGEKRDGTLLEANRVLASAAEKMAQQFDAIRALMHGEGDLKLRDAAEKPADLAPLIGQLEEATEAATVEVKDLHQLLLEEREQHAATKKRSQQEISELKRKVELLTQAIEAERVATAEREAALRAEMEQKLTELKKAGEARVAEVEAAAARREDDLQKQLAESKANFQKQLAESKAVLKTEHEAAVTILRDKIKAAVEALEAAKQDLAGQEVAYEKLMVDTGEVETSLRERIRDLEQAFALPMSLDAAPARADGSGDPETEEKVDALYQSIIETSRKNKALAIKQFESLPEESVKPTALLKVMANLYREKRDYTEAYNIYEEVLERDPGNLYAERKLVMTLFDMGRYDEALERLAGPQTGGTQ